MYEEFIQEKGNKQNYSFRFFEKVLNLKGYPPPIFLYFKMRIIGKKLFLIFKSYFYKSSSIA